MATLYLTTQGAKLSRQSQRLVITKDEETLEVIPLIKVDQVLVFGNVQVTTPAIRLLLAHGVDLVFLTQDGRYCGRLVGEQSRHSALRRQQYNRADDPVYRQALAQRLAAGKLHNMRVLLQRYNRNLQREEIAQAVSGIEAMLRHIPRTQTLNSLNGAEGKGTALYFGCFRYLLKADLGFRTRQRRPPPDPVNVLLSYTYTLLQHRVESAVYTVGLDPYVGFLHAEKYSKPSLTLDLMEEFRPIVADSVVLRVINSGLITQANFSQTDDPERPVLLDEVGRRRLIREFEARLSTEVIHPVTQERLSYRRCFETQARLLARCLIEGRPDYRPMTVR